VFDDRAGGIDLHQAALQRRVVLHQLLVEHIDVAAAVGLHVAHEGRPTGNGGELVEVQAGQYQRTGMARVVVT
jgi:hypothetical protein